MAQPAQRILASAARAPRVRATLAVALVLVAGGALLPGSTARAQEDGRPALPPCPGNLLRNPGFEEGFAARGRIEETLPLAWSAWYETLPGVDGLNYPPRYAPRFAPPGGARAGGAAQGLWSVEMRTDEATHTGGLWQRVAVEPGSQLLASVAARGWATEGAFEEISEPPGTYALALGIDPAGGTDARSSDIVWTQPITVTDAWLPLSLDLPVEGPEATLFLRGQALEILDHSASRWDAACLRRIGPAGEPTESPTPAPPPTRTPDPGAPTETPAPATVTARETSLAFGFSGTATARAAERAAEPGQRATVQAAETRMAVLRAPAAPIYGDEDLPPEIPRAARLAERSGWLALVAASFCVGLLLALRGREAG